MPANRLMTPLPVTLVILCPLYSQMYQFSFPSKATPKGSMSLASRAGPPSGRSPQPATHSMREAGMRAWPSVSMKKIPRRDRSLPRRFHPPPIVNGKAFVILRVFASSSWIEHSPYHEDAKKREVFGYLCSSVLLTCKSFAAWKEFFFAVNSGQRFHR